MRTISLLLLFLSTFPIQAVEQYPIKEIKGFDLSEPIHNATVNHVEEIIRAHCKTEVIILFKMDTPGGQLSSTKKIIQSFTNSRCPIVV